MSKVSIKLLSHACVLIKIDELKIITDPWFFGTAFNDGWELYPKPNLSEIQEIVEDVDIIWISHEHPDHFHFPTLKWLSDICPNDTKIFFQATNSDKVFDALKKIGFNNFTSMQHRKKIKVNERVDLACYAHRHLDCCLAVFIDGIFWALNINDTELDENDIKIIKNDWSSPTIILNQFSIAGTSGIERKLGTDASWVLEKMANQHRGLGTKLTIPFASFCRFARKDNNYVNKFSNSPLDVKEKFDKEGLPLALVSYNSDELIWTDLRDAHDNLIEIDNLSLLEYEEIFSKNEEVFHEDKFEYVTHEAKDVQQTIQNKLSYWRSKTNILFWRNLLPIKIRVSDWGNEVWIINFKNLTFLKTEAESDYDISIASQPLKFSFTLPFGIQTLGVSGRYKFNEDCLEVPKTWKLVRIMSSLYNQDIFISFRGLFSIDLIRWAWRRREGLTSQIKQQFKRFFK